MTGKRAPLLGPLGRRLLGAFMIVALASVVVLTVAALVGSDRGLRAATRQEHQATADRVATAVASVYARDGGWDRDSLGAIQSLADASQARLVVRDDSGRMVWPGHSTMGGPDRSGSGPAGTAQGPAGTAQSPAGTAQSPAGTAQGPGSVVTVPVRVDGQQVGTVSLVFPPDGSAGRTVAWRWIAGAAAVAVVMAFGASWFVTRRLTAPMSRVSAAARAFADGDRAARAQVRAPGELGELAHAVNTMADQVVHTEQVRRQLAADVAHELRNPLASLQAGLEELRDGLRAPDPASLASLHDQALRLGRVVADLAELSAAESAALSLHPTEVDLATLAAAAVADQEPRLRAAGLEIHTGLSTPAPVWADPDRLHQAVGNLLANAARYCRPGDRVSVRVHPSDDGGVLVVSDTGPGIPPEELPHVFDRLWRGRASRSVAGSGIGLAVVRELITAQGGTVSVDSPPGRGTTFILRLPRSASAARTGRRATTGR